MAKDRRKLLHIHSSVPDKQPTAASLEVGEIAVNNAKDQEFLSLKNSDNKVVRFSSDNNIINWVERKEVIPYSGVVDNVHLDTNRSNIEIKLNQVVASATTKHDKVNGARDIDNNLVNPTTDGGITDGAGFAIDMSRYAMIGANPSFSSVTVSHGSNLSGVTNISNGTGGSKLNITTTNVETQNTNWTENVTNRTANVSGTNTMASTGNTCISSSNNVGIGGVKNTYVGKSCDGTNVTTGNTAVYGGTVDVNSKTKTNIISSGDTVIHSEGKIGLTSKGDLTAVSTEGSMTISANKSLCESAGEVAAIMGEEKTNVGVNCNGNEVSPETNVYGININLSGTTTISGNTNIKNNLTVSGNTNISGNTIVKGATTINNNLTVSGNTNISGNTTINKNITVKGNTYLSGNTYFNNTCEDIESNELSNALCEVLNKAITSASTNVTVTASTPSTTGNIYKTYTVQQDGVNKEVGIEIPNLTITESAGDVKSYTIKYNGVERSTITIPKDLVVTSGSVVRGTWNGDTFTKNPNGPDTAIELVIANDESQKIYINTADLVKDSVYSSSTDSITIVTGYSAGHQDVDINMKKGHAVLKITHNGLVNKEYDPAVSGETLVLPHSALTITYGATSGKSGSVIYNTSASSSVTIPTCVNHLNRHKITFQSGSTASFNNQTYDPGKDCANSAETINIPTSVCHLNRGSLTLTQGNTVLGTYDPCSANTINIPAAVIPSANPLNICYDNTCGESGCVTYDTSSAITVNIPATIAHVTCGDIVDRNAGTSGAVITSNARSTTINSSSRTTLNVGESNSGVLELNTSNVSLGSTGTTLLGTYGYGPSGLEVGNLVYVQSKNVDIRSNSGTTISSSGGITIRSNSGITVSSTDKLNVGSVSGRTSVSGFDGVDIDGNVGGVTIKGQGVSLRGNEDYVSSLYKTCIESSGKTRVYGTEETVVGKSCDNKVGSATTVIGSATTISGGTVEVTGNSVSLSGYGVNIYSPADGINIWHNAPYENVGSARFGSTENTYIVGEKNVSVSGRAVTNISSNSTNISSNNKVNVTSYGTSVQSVDISAISGGTRLSTYKNLAVRTTGNTSIVSTGDTTINGSGVTVSALETLDLKATNSPAPGVNAGVINLQAFEINTKNCYYANIDASELMLRGASKTKISSQGGVKIETLSEYGKTEIISSGNTNITTKSATTISSNTISIRAVGSGKTSADTSIDITASDGKVSTNGDSIYSRSRAGITEFTSSKEVRLESYDRQHGQGSGITMILGDGCLSIDGDVCVDGKITATGAIYSSDERLKENIRNIPYDKVMASSKIMLTEFNFKDDETKRKTYGVIAQDVIKAGLVDIVHEKEDGMYGVDYTSLLILKNQFLDEQLRIMSSKIRNLERKIEELSKKD